VSDIHVTPFNDLREHEDARTCWCRPTQDDEEPSVWVHHSLDGRERTKEKGRLQ
jgi:hypothetical protein